MASALAQPSDVIQGVYIVPLRQFGDDRGHFFETFRRGWVPDAREMVQGNCSFSKAGVLRGMHYHLKQADFWVVPSGHVRAAMYDMRASSPTRGRNQVIDMGDANRIGLYIPKGVAHGFCSLVDSLVTYLVDEFYDNSDERGVRWDDPALSIDWQVGAPILSGRDQQNPLLADIPPSELPR